MHPNSIAYTSLVPDKFAFNTLGVKLAADTAAYNASKNELVEGELVDELSVLYGGFEKVPAPQEEPKDV